jgi:hypothetical protein
MAPHFQKQISQKVGIFRSPGADSGIATAFPASRATPAVADVAAIVAAEICRKRRRERESMRPLGAAQLSDEDVQRPEGRV